MLSAEFAYRLGTLRRLVLKIIGKSISIVFILAALATLGLMAYEFGYAVSETGEKLVEESFQIILRIFFYGSLVNIALERKNIWREKGVWVEIIVLLLLLLILITRSSHLPDQGWLPKTNHILMHILLLLISIIQLSKVLVTTFQRRIRPEMTFTYSFLLFILMGAVLLMLPRAHQGTLSFIDALFMSTSAVCITGLTVIDISVNLTTTGQVILLLLIQIGGIGVMTFTSFIALSFFTQTSFNDQMALKNILSEESMNNIFRTLLYTFFTTLTVEAVGAWLIWLSVKNLENEAIANPLFFSVFHSVSAFCNAGFSLLPDNLSHPAIRHLYKFQWWISILIILGGIGFPIVFNYGKLLNHKIRNVFYRITGSSKRMPSHVRIVSTTTRIVITTTAFLLVGGTLLYWLAENHHSLAGLPWNGKLIYSFFGAVTPRTAGFNLTDTAALMPATIALTLFLMWIGASPLSTGGGIKTTTFTIAVKNILSTLQGKDKVEIFKRHLPSQNVRRAHAIILLSLLWIGAATLLLAFLVPYGQVTQLLFEVVSAISTVGLTLDFTPHLNTAGKIIISLTMFIGRVGFISLLAGLIHQQSSQDYTYAEDNVIL